MSLVKQELTLTQLFDRVRSCNCLYLIIEVISVEHAYLIFTDHNNTVMKNVFNDSLVFEQLGIRNNHDNESTTLPRASSHLPSTGKPTTSSPGKNKLSNDTKLKCQFEEKKASISYHFLYIL